jgi:glycosyltransferase involved in cell wall biosynthesis
MRDVDADLLLVGTGPLREPLEKAAREAGVAARVHFLGEIDNRALAPYYFALARALTRILSDRALARRMGEAGRVRVHREFSKEVMAERMLALYEEVTHLRVSHGPVEATSRAAQ